MAKTAPRRLERAKAQRTVQLGSSGLANAVLALLLVPSLTLGSAAAAQSILPPAPPPANPVQGPPDGAIPPGPPIRFPTPAPAPTPTSPPPVTPAPGPAPTPAPAPTPTRERPQTPRDQPPAREADRARPAQPATPAQDAPLVAPPEAPSTLEEPASISPDAPVPPSPDELGWPAWLPFALLGALGAAGAALWAWRRRRRHAPTVESNPVAPPLAAKPAPVPAQKPTKVQATAARPAMHLDVNIEPLAASTTLVNLRVRYAFVLHNPTDSDVSVTGQGDTILAGSGAQEAAIRQWFAAAPHGPDIAAVVPANGDLRIERELAVPLGQLSGMYVRGRVVLIPVLLLSLTYRHATGLGQIGRAFVIGKPGAVEAKLGPLPLDQGMGGFGPLVARDTGIALNV